MNLNITVKPHLKLLYTQQFRLTSKCILYLKFFNWIKLIIILRIVFLILNWTYVNSLNLMLSMEIMLRIWDVSNIELHKNTGMISMPQQRFCFRMICYTKEVVWHGVICGSSFMMKSLFKHYQPLCYNNA